MNPNTTAQQIGFGLSHIAFGAPCREALAWSLRKPLTEHQVIAGEDVNKLHYMCPESCLHTVLRTWSKATFLVNLSSWSICFCQNCTEHEHDNVISRRFTTSYLHALALHQCVCVSATRKYQLHDCIASIRLLKGVAGCIQSAAHGIQQACKIHAGMQQRRI